MAELRSHKPSLRDQIAWFFANQVGGLGADRHKQQYVAKKVGGLIDFLPGVGEAVGVDDTARAAKAGDWAGAGLNLGATVLGAAPVVGDMAGKGVKKGAKFVEDYWGGHRAPRRSDENAPLHELTRLYPDDVYGPNTAQYYGHAGAGDPVDEGTARILRKFRGNPDAEVTVYRAVPKDAPDLINPGDWVTINPDYARTHGDGPLQGDYKIIKTKARAKDLFTDANSIHEFGYDPE